MKHWPVPESFGFPKGATLIDGWRFWLEGGFHFDEGGKPWKVKPYRELKGGDMKTKAMKDDLQKWRSVYSLMESAVTLPSDKADITQEVVLSTFNSLTQCFRTITATSSWDPTRRQAGEAQGWDLVSKDAEKRGFETRD